MSTNPDLIEEEVIEESVIEEAANENDPVETEALDPDLEARARRQGWRPKDEFNKDPSDWKPAEEFLEVAETEMPVLRERMRNMEKQIQGMDQTLEFQKHERTLALQEERERLGAQYDARLRETVEAGDGDAFDRIQQEKTAHLKEPPAPSTNDLPAAIREFMDENKWYGENEDMTEFAEAQNLVVRQHHPDWSDELVMRQIGARVKQAYPQNKTPATRQQTVEGGRRPKPQTKSKSFDNLPAEYKAGFSESAAHGLVTNDDDGRARFAEVYYSQQGE